MRTISLVFNKKITEDDEPRAQRIKQMINIDTDLSMQVTSGGVDSKAILMIDFKNVGFDVSVKSIDHGDAIFEKIKQVLYMNVPVLCGINIAQSNDMVDIFLKFGAFSEHSENQLPLINRILINTRTGELNTEIITYPEMKEMTNIHGQNFNLL